MKKTVRLLIIICCFYALVAYFDSKDSKSKTKTTETAQCGSCRMWKKSTEHKEPRK